MARTIRFVSRSRNYILYMVGNTFIYLLHTIGKIEYTIILYE